LTIALCTLIAAIAGIAFCYTRRRGDRDARAADVLAASEVRMPRDVPWFVTPHVPDADADGAGVDAFEAPLDASDELTADA
jgi:hypothetical protein